MSDSALIEDRQLADAVARAERRRDRLERLSEIGMELAEEIRERNVGAPYHPEPRHDPGRAFAAVSRAVRLTTALEARMDEQIVALRKGGVPAPNTTAAAPPPFAPLFGSISKDSTCPRRNRVRDAVWGAINQELREIHEAHGVLDRLHESLIEREDYEDLLSGPWRACVEAICADLGLSPDWSLWSDEDGFAADLDKPRYDWPNGWTYWPEHAEERRRKGIGRRGRATTDPPPDQ